MSDVATRTPLVAIAGNPNTGKTTLFNRLTGARQKVGNYPGVTVDRHEGTVRLPGQSARLVDVPGCYSLSARSEEEQIAVQATCGLPPFEAPEVVVLVLDATQLRRNLYLAVQLLETRVPLVVALNQMDLVEKSGSGVDASALSEDLGVPVVPTTARTGEGIDRLREEIEKALSRPTSAAPGPPWKIEDSLLEADVERIEEALPGEWGVSDPDRRRALALWAMLSLDDQDEVKDVPAGLREKVASRRKLATAAGRDLDLDVVQARYSWIDARLGRWVVRAGQGRLFTERIDAVLLNPLLGFVIFLVLMGIVFQSLFSWSDPLIGMVETGFEALAGWVTAVMGEGLLREFITDGLIAGVGSVVVFLPQILMLFLFVAVLEDSGYMARVAFLMDRIMRSLGLHGRAFVPMMSGFACAIPAVMATRTMERKRDRLLTMMVVPLMTCAARLPVYTLIIAALFPPSTVMGFMPVQGLLMVSMYLFSTLVALVAVAVLSRTVLKGPSVPLILELPPYRLPEPGNVLRTMWEKGRVFLAEAGTVILVCTIALWGLLAFPKTAPDAANFEARRAEAVAELPAEEVDATLEVIDAEEEGSRVRASYAGRVGQLLEPMIEPLGFDWKIGVGLIGSFAAREVFVATMGIVYGIGEADEESSTLREQIRAETRADGAPVYTPLVGLSLMVFFALACQCMSTVAAVKRETAGWRWPTFMLVYMTVLAWAASFIVYQGGQLIGFS